jgi:hypothetical protein
MAGKGQSPLLGYNTNVRHKGRVFHIQTEDSGVQHPHVITHLFADGGRILKSQKTSYGDLLEAADMQSQVKKIMQEQHKAMFIALRDGQFDHLLDPDVSQRVGAVNPPPELDTADISAQWRGQPAVPAPTPVSPADAPPPAPAQATPTPGGTLRTGTLPRTPTSPGTPRVPTGAGAPAKPSTAGEGLPRTSSSAGTPAAGARSQRYAPVRAPEILGSFKPKPVEGGSIFGDGMMSEKSLDEVILAYLADDLDEGKKP